MIYDGFNGGTIELLEDVLIIRRKGVVSAINHGRKGEKRIPYGSITSVQFKEAGLTTGYIQFGVTGGSESKGGVMAATKDENTVLFTSKAADTFRQLRDIVERRSIEAKYAKPASPASPAPVNVGEELIRLADLRDRGILSDDEFNSEKARLLGGKSTVRESRQVDGTFLPFPSDFVSGSSTAADVPAETPSSNTGKKIAKGCGIGVGALILLAVAGAIFGESAPTNSSAPEPVASEAAAAVAEPTKPELPEAGVTAANYARLRNGMTYEQVTDILGGPGEELSSSDLAGTKTAMYQWEGNGFGANMNAIFQNGKMVQKAQMGLE